jgi:hypothetical protein
MVDTDGRALELQVHPASIQDRDGAVPLLQMSRRSFPFIEHAFADTAYAEAARPRQRVPSRWRPRARADPAKGARQTG